MTARGMALPNVVAYIAKSVGCFQRRLSVCLFVCQHDNFRTSKHRMMKLGGRCIVQKSRPSLNLGVIAPWMRPPPKKKRNVALGYGVGKIGTGCQVSYIGSNWFEGFRNANGHRKYGEVRDCSATFDTFAYNP